MRVHTGGGVHFMLNTTLQEEKKDLNHTLRGKVGVVKRVISYFSLVLNYMEMASIFLKNPLHFPF